MIKKISKILLLFLSLILVLAIGFILTLQVTEYNPEESVVLTIDDNLPDGETSYVSLDTTIRVLSFNTGYASLSETEDFVMDGGIKGRMDSLAEVQTNIDGITAILEEKDADIYLLQEVDQVSDRSYDTDQLSAYQDALQMPITIGYNYRVLFVPFPFEIGQMMGNVNSGIVTMINYHVDSATRVQLPGSFSWPLRLANLKRCMVISRIPIQGSDKEFIVINVHLSAYDDGTMRLQEMEAVKAILEEETANGNYVLLGGDFNQTFPDAVTITGTGASEVLDYIYPLKNPDYWQAFPMENDWFIDHGFQFGVDITTPTCRLLNRPLDLVNEEMNQYYVIDGFIVSSNISIELIQTQDEGFKFSDHNPVMIEIKLIS